MTLSPPTWILAGGSDLEVWQSFLHQMTTGLLGYTYNIGLAVVACVSAFTICTSGVTTAINRNGAEVLEALVRTILVIVLILSYNPLMSFATNAMGAFSSQIEIMLNRRMSDPRLSAKNYSDVVLHVFAQSSNHHINRLNKIQDDLSKDRAATAGPWGWIFKGSSYILEAFWMFVYAIPVWVSIPIVYIASIAPMIAVMGMYFINAILLALLFVSGPIALAFSAHPGTRRISTTWLNNLVKALLFYPVLGIALCFVLSFVNNFHGIAFPYTESGIVSTGFVFLVNLALTILTPIMLAAFAAALILNSQTLANTLIGQPVSSIIETTAVHAAAITSGLFTGAVMPLLARPGQAGLRGGYLVQAGDEVQTLTRTLRSHVAARRSENVIRDAVKESIGPTTPLTKSQGGSSPNSPPQTPVSPLQQAQSATDSASLRQFALNSTGLMGEDDHKVQNAILANPNTPESVVNLIAARTSHPETAAMAASRTTDADTLARLAENNVLPVRQSVAENPHTPRITLRNMLTQDNNEPLKNMIDKRLASSD